MEKNRILFLSVLLVLAGHAQGEQVCRPGNFDTVRLEVAADQTVIDRQARLQWQRCPQGLRGEKCEQGQLDRSNIRQAADLADKANRQGDAGKQGWRLPTVAELARLVSKKCLNPAIDLKIFPNSPAVEFWGSDSDGAQSGYVDFKDGYIGMDDENLPNAVRLVRDLPAATPGKGKGRPARQG